MDTLGQIKSTLDKSISIKCIQLLLYYTMLPLSNCAFIHVSRKYKKKIQKMPKQKISWPYCRREKNKNNCLHSAQHKKKRRANILPPMSPMMMERLCLNNCLRRQSTNNASIKRNVMKCKKSKSYKVFS